MLVDEERIETSIDNAKADIVTAETDELEKEQSMLDTVASGLGNSFRISIGRLFGGALSNEEVEKVTEEVEGKLQEETHNMLRTQAQQSVDREFDRVAEIAQEDELSGYGAEEIQTDLYEQELQGANAIRDDIDSAADNAKTMMKKRAAEIEKEILEERLSQKMGKRVKVVIVDDEVKGIENDVNNLLQGLNTLAPPPQGGYGMPPQQQSPYGAAPVQQSSSIYGYGMQQPPAQPAAPVSSYGASVAYGTDPNQYGNNPSPYGSSTSSSVVPPSTGSNYYGSAPAAASSTSTYGSSATTTSNAYDTTTTSTYGATAATTAESTTTTETTTASTEAPPKKSGYSSLFGGWSSSSKTEETTTEAATETTASSLEQPDSSVESSTTETTSTSSYDADTYDYGSDAGSEAEEEEEEEEEEESGDW